MQGYQRILIKSTDCKLKNLILKFLRSFFQKATMSNSIQLYLCFVLLFQKLFYLFIWYLEFDIVAHRTGGFKTKSQAGFG